jgi:hypothetical protein
MSSANLFNQGGAPALMTSTSQQHQQQYFNLGGHLMMNLQQMTPAAAPHQNQHYFANN